MEDVPRHRTRKSSDDEVNTAGPVNKNGLCHLGETGDQRLCTQSPKGLVIVVNEGEDEWSVTIDG